MPSPGQLNELRTSLGLAAGDYVLGTVGRLFDDVKRVSDVLRAVERLRPDIPTVRLVVVGDGPDRSELEQLATDLGLADVVAWAGYQASPAPFYHLMDAFVLASSREAFGLVLVEAMFARRPVVATEVGGIPDVLAGGAAGLLIPPGRPDKLAEAVRRLKAEPSLARQLAAAGAQRAGEEFTAQRYANDVRGLYYSLLDPEAGSSR